MTDPLPTVPNEIQAGDTLKVLFSFGDYPASDGWVVTAYFSGANTNFNKAAVQEPPTTGDGHLLTLDPADTLMLAPEAITWAAKAVKGAETFTADKGTALVLADPSTTGNTDTRSHNVIMVQALKDTMQGKATKDQMEYTIKDRSLKRMTAKEMTDWLTFYEKRLSQEIREEDGVGPKKILTEFRTP